MMAMMAVIHRGEGICRTFAGLGLQYGVPHCGLSLYLRNARNQRYLCIHDTRSTRNTRSTLWCTLFKILGYRVEPGGTFAELKFDAGESRKL
jgi:hypothetical protein